MKTIIGLWILMNFYPVYGMKFEAFPSEDGQNLIDSYDNALATGNRAALNPVFETVINPTQSHPGLKAKLTDKFLHHESPVMPWKFIQNAIRMNYFNELEINYTTISNIFRFNFNQFKMMLFNVLRFGYQKSTQESISTEDQESFLKSLQKNHHYTGPLSFGTRLELYDALDKYIAEQLPHNLTCVSLFAINSHLKTHGAFSEYTKRYYKDKCMTIDPTRREVVYNTMIQIDKSYKKNTLCRKMAGYLYADQVNFDIDLRNIDHEIRKSAANLLRITNELDIGQNFIDFWRKYPQQSKTDIMKKMIKKQILTKKSLIYLKQLI
jgi:hypothetical protein